MISVVMLGKQLQSCGKRLVVETEVKPGLYHTHAGSFFNIHPNGRDYDGEFDRFGEREACFDCDLSFTFGITVGGDYQVTWSCDECELNHRAVLHPGPWEECIKC